MTHPAAKKDAFTQLLLVTLVIIILVRFALLGSYPLLGTTEPRYAELARKMLATGDWVTLWVLDGVPLWGKPPLLFWLDTISMGLFGVNEFAVRLPPFLASLGTLSLLWFWPTKSSKMPLIAGLIYISTPVGFLATGFVATDIFLAGGLALSMVSFWRAVSNNESNDNQPNQTTIWHWLFFVGMAIGLLAKGPLSLVLLGVALLLWVSFDPIARVRLAWQSLPWWRGLALMALLAFPWYIMAEIRTPGFLNHFIIGEHIQRFLVKDWDGGRFAPSHGEPLGMIWWFALESFMPWILLIIPSVYVLYKTKPSLQVQYLLCWVLAPLLFFSLSHNILEAYVLPALPAFAILMGLAIDQLILQRRGWRWSMLLAAITPLVMLVLVLFFYQAFETQSQKHLLKNWTPSTPLIYVGGVPPSGVFYSNNQAKEAASFSAIEKMQSQQPRTVVMHQTIFDSLSPKQKTDWQLIEAYSEYVMLRK